ncbi:MAG: cytochrome c [Aureispira sp.]|nr:cytochrome c [Aureispira sp.]
MKMNTIFKLGVALALFSMFALTSCGGDEGGKTTTTTTTTTTDNTDPPKEEPKEDPKEEPKVEDKALADKMTAGEAVYTKVCVACHQASGEGVPKAFPPLAKSDYLNEDVDRSIEIVLKGKTGEITVNGEKYNSAMTPQALTSEEVADVLTYVYNSWENNKANVTVADVERVKNAH